MNVDIYNHIIVITVIIICVVCTCVHTIRNFVSWQFTQPRSSWHVCIGTVNGRFMTNMKLCIWAWLPWVHGLASQTGKIIFCHHQLLTATMLVLGHIFVLFHKFIWSRRTLNLFPWGTSETFLPPLLSAAIIKHTKHVLVRWSIPPSLSESMQSQFKHTVEKNH